MTFIENLHALLNKMESGRDEIERANQMCLTGTISITESQKNGLAV